MRTPEILLISIKISGVTRVRTDDTIKLIVKNQAADPHITPRLISAACQVSLCSGSKPTAANAPKKVKMVIGFARVMMQV